MGMFEVERSQMKAVIGLNLSRCSLPFILSTSAPTNFIIIQIINSDLSLHFFSQMATFPSLPLKLLLSISDISMEKSDP